MLRQVATFAGSVVMEGDEDDEPISAAVKPRHPSCLGLVRALFEFPSFDLRLRMKLQPRLSSRWALFQPTVTLIVDRFDCDVRTFTGRVRWAWTSEKVSAQLFSQPTAEDQRAFIDAVHSLVTLQHPNLLRVYATSTSGRDVFVISPFLDTTDVLDRLIDCPSLERERVVLAAARAISYLHSRDETHGDINAYNVLMTRTNDVIVAGFGPLCRPVTLSAEPAATSNKPSWATVVDDLSGSEVEVESDASDDPDWQPPYRPRRNSDVPLESSLGDRVLHHMRSSTVEGDVFAFGFFIVQMFTGLAPCDSVDSLRLLRMVLNGQRPRHPGRSAEVRGLDEIHWQICQRCWSHSTTMDDIIAALEAPRPNVIRCPVRWDLVSLEAFAAHTAPTLTRQIRDVQKVRSGRDIECRWLEMHGILHGDSVRAVNLIPPHACRRRLGKLGTEQVGFSSIA
ncbi:kinase-like protein [Exidia glandulosa HHB12029]|uniref:Kinase-like protein n=1 Tax=Exidia glandulosa HHB12029 TaxID=1314781 RepID=A0A166MST1_EXIGL|nr:kinase-like protein [Exidia glandulosa HHB12029]